MNASAETVTESDTTLLATAKAKPHSCSQLPRPLYKIFIHVVSFFIQLPENETVEGPSSHQDVTVAQTDESTHLQLVGV